MTTGGAPHLDKSWVGVLAEVPLFRGLSRRHLARVAELGVERRVPVGTMIVREGDLSDAFYVILDGLATVRRAGHRATRLHAGDFFGEIGLLDGAGRTRTIEAETETTLMVIGRSDFLRLLEKEPKIAVTMLVTVAARLRAEIALAARAAAVESAPAAPEG